MYCLHNDYKVQPGPKGFPLISRDFLYEFLLLASFQTEQPQYICVHAASLPGMFLAAGYTRFAHS